MNFGKVREIVKGTIREFGEDRVLRLGAALAYYAMFSLGPLLLIIVGIVGFFLGEDTVRGNIQAYLAGAFGTQSSGIVESMMDARKQGTTVLATVVGTVVLLFGAGGVFGQLQDALNTIWEVKPRPGRGLKGMIRDRFLSLTMVLGLGFLLLVSMILSTVLSASSAAVGRVFQLPAAAAWLLDLGFSLAMITVLFAMIFKFLPDVKVPWRNVWSGAVGTALLFTIGKMLLALYLGRESTASAYGAAGAVIIVMMWVYYASVILFLGAEFTQVHAKVSGVTIQPTANAIPVREAERLEQGSPHKGG